MKDTTTNTEAHASQKATASRNNMSPKEFRELAGGMSCAALEEYLGVSPATLRRYKAENGSIPGAVARLMRIRFGKDVTDLLGDEWEGFYFGVDGKIYVPGWRGGFNPHEIKAMFFRVQLVSHLEATIRSMEKRIAGLERDVIEANETAAKYRRLVSNEAKFGLMFSPLTSELPIDGDSHHEVTP